MENGTEIKTLERALQDATAAHERAVAEYASTSQTLRAVERGEKDGNIAELMEAQRLKALARTAAENQRGAADSALYRARVSARSEAWKTSVFGVQARVAALVPTLQYELLELMELTCERLNEYDAQGGSCDLAVITGLPAEVVSNLLNGLARAVSGTGLANVSPNLELLDWMEKNIRPEALPGVPTFTIAWPEFDRAPVEVDPNARTEPYPVPLLYNGQVIGYEKQ